MSDEDRFKGALADQVLRLFKEKGDLLSNTASHVVVRTRGLLEEIEDMIEEMDDPKETLYLEGMLRSRRETDPNLH